MTSDRSLFSTLVPSTITVLVANGTHIQATGSGTVFLHFGSPDSKSLSLFDVLLVPGLTYNLISVSKLNLDYLRVVFSEQLEAVISDPFRRDLVVRVPWKPESQSYLLTVSKAPSLCLPTALCTVHPRDSTHPDVVEGEELAPPASTSQISQLWRLWHERLAHVGPSSASTLAQNSIGFPPALAKYLRQGQHDRCSVCSLTNIKRRPASHRNRTTSRALELVHADLSGKLIVPSLGGALYIAIIVDDFTRMVWVLPLARKSDFKDAFIRWRDEMVPFKGPLACLRTDGGGEFENASMREALGGVRHERSCPYTSQQNGVAERHLGVLKTRVRALIHARKVPLRYWAEAASTAAWIKNRTPSATLDGLTPYELWHGTKPDLTELRVFGCLAFPMLPDRAREHSLSLRSRVGVFIGYDQYHKGYRIHIPSDNTVQITRNVDFHEEKGYDFGRSTSPPDHVLPPDDVTFRSVPLAPGSAPDLVVGRPQVQFSPDAFLDRVEVPPLTPLLQSAPHVPAHPPAFVEPVPPGWRGANDDAPASSSPASDVRIHTTDPVSAAEPAPITHTRTSAIPAPRKSTRQVQPVPSRDYNALTRRSAQPVSAKQSRRAARAAITTHTAFAVSFHARLSAEGVELEPETLKEAMKRPDWDKWHEAMRKEMDSHAEMGTWTIVEAPKGKPLVGCRWVFKLKLDKDGYILQYKARLVAQGFSQIHGLNYTDTYSPVVAFSTLRALFALAAFHEWFIEQLDVITAYLYGLLKEEIYMEQAPGFKITTEDGRQLACRLLRSLYGLKQSGREWFFTLRAALLELGFRPSSNDPAVFIRGEGPTAIIIAVYVDDMLVMGKALEEIAAVKAELAKRFKMKDQGPVGQFLGMRVERSDNLKSFFISQPTYIKAMLNRFGYEAIKPVGVPLDPSQRIEAFDGEVSDEDRKRYQEMMGCFNWLAQASRPDLSFPVSVLSRHSKNPGPHHFGCAKRIFRYLAGTINHRLEITSHSPDSIVAYSDSDFGGDHSAKSTTGFLVSLHGSAIAWGSKLQSLIADSTAQAEVIALWHTSREVLALRYFLEDLGINHASAPPSIIYCDNQPAIHIVTNPTNTKLSRHMERKYLSTREHNERGLINTTYINTKLNPADLFTKPLPAASFHQHRHTIGVVDPAPSPTPLMEGSVAEQS